VFRAITTPMVVKLRMLDFKGVMDLFGMYGEREMEDSFNEKEEDHESEKLKEKLFDIYRFSKM
jgi:hypothetical protein